MISPSPDSECFLRPPRCLLLISRNLKVGMWFVAERVRKGQQYWLAEPIVQIEPGADQIRLVFAAGDELVHSRATVRVLDESIWTRKLPSIALPAPVTRAEVAPSCAHVTMGKPLSGISEEVGSAPSKTGFVVC